MTTQRIVTTFFSFSNIDSVQVADTFKVGLTLLRRPDVKPYLVELGKRCVKAWRDPKNAIQYKGYTWPGDISKMRHYVDIFLNGIQNSPPAIIVDPSIGGTFAETVKDIGSSYAGNLENFLPQDAVSFGLNAKVCGSYCDLSSILGRLRSLR